MIIQREALLDRIRVALGRSPVVALLGPRQAGKTTLGRWVASERRAVVFDLEDPADLARLALPKQVLEPLDGLVVLDEIQLRPDLLPILRVLVDRQPLRSKFLVLASASPDLLRGASESLAGRVEFVDVFAWGFMALR